MRILALLPGVLLLFASLLFVTCKKNDKPGAGPGADMIDKVNQWLDKQKGGDMASKAGAIDLLKENLDFENKWVEKLNDKESMVLVPVKEEYKAKKQVEREALPVLLVVTDELNNVERSSLVFYLPKDGEQVSRLPKNSFHDLYNSRALPLKGIFRFHKISGGMLYQFGLKEGRINSYGTLEKRTPTTAKASGEICIDWYLTTRYYENGIIVSQTSEYLGTTCGCQPTGKTTTVILTSCDDNSTSGGGSSTTSCCLPDPNLQWNTSAVSQSVGDQCDPATTNRITGLVTKTCKHTWYFNRNTLGFWAWDFTSTEESSEAWQNGKWVFKSVNHAWTGMEGAPPPCVTSTCAIVSTTPYFYGNGARMTLAYRMSLSYTCSPVSVSRTIDASASSQWVAS